MSKTCQYCDNVFNVAISTGAIAKCLECRKTNLLLNRDENGVAHFADYDLFEEVGTGGNAIVCRARKRSTDEGVAVKLFNTEKKLNSHAAKEFLREFEFAIDLVHDNVVRVYCGGEEEGIFYLEMEYFKGVNLIQYLNQYGPMDPMDAMAVGAHVGTALDYVWSSFMSIHRDMKPQNIMIGDNGVVKVCDFGLAATHERAEVDISAVEGTPYYLSPEGIIQDAYQDNRSDIYSLGATLYHVITGEPPFNYDTIDRVLNSRLTEDPPDITKEVEDVPAGVADVLKTMMSREPDARYVTAAECVEDIIRVQSGEAPLLVDPKRSRVNQ